MEVDSPRAGGGGGDKGVAESKSSEGGAEEGGDAMTPVSPKAGEAKEEAEALPEPTSMTLGNPARVTLAQEPYVSFELEASKRYVPVRKGSKPIGIVLLVDRRPEEPEDVAKVESPPLEGDEDEAEPPEPFEWSPPM